MTGLRCLLSVPSLLRSVHSATPTSHSLRRESTRTFTTGPHTSSSDPTQIQTPFRYAILPSSNWSSRPPTSHRRTCRRSRVPEKEDGTGDSDTPRPYFEHGETARVERVAETHCFGVCRVRNWRVFGDNWGQTDTRVTTPRMSTRGRGVQTVVGDETLGSPSSRQR